MDMKAVRVLRCVALAFLVPIAAIARASVPMYFCVNRDNGIKDKIITIYRDNSTVAVRELPGETFTALAQFGSDGSVRWNYVHKGTRASGSVTYLLNLSTNMLYTHLSAVTLFGTKVTSNMQWTCRKMQ